MNLLPLPSPHPCSNVHIEAEINRLRAELLHKDQDHDRMSLQLAAEKEERERAQVRGQAVVQRQLRCSGSWGAAQPPGMWIHWRAANALRHASRQLYLPAQLPAPSTDIVFCPRSSLFCPPACLQRKVDTMTRLMLDGGRGEAAAGGGGSGGKPRRENRRETWCPGAGGWQAANAALADLAGLLGKLWYVSVRSYLLPIICAHVSPLCSRRRPQAPADAQPG